jgi:hypothetical protein
MLGVCGQGLSEQLRTTALLLSGLLVYLSVATYQVGLMVCLLLACSPQW